MTDSNPLYGEYLRDVAFKTQIEDGCPDHSTDVLNELFLCKINKLNPDLLFDVKLTLETAQVVREVMMSQRKRYNYEG